MGNNKGLQREIKRIKAKFTFEGKWYEDLDSNDFGILRKYYQQDLNELAKITGNNRDNNEAIRFNKYKINKKINSVPEVAFLTNIDACNLIRAYYSLDEKFESAFRWNIISYCALQDVRFHHTLAEMLIELNMIYGGIIVRNSQMSKLIKEDILKVENKILNNICNRETNEFKYYDLIFIRDRYLNFFKFLDDIEIRYERLKLIAD